MPVNELTKITVDFSKIKKEAVETLLKDLGFSIVNDNKGVFDLQKIDLNADPKTLARLDWIVSVKPAQQFEGLKTLQKSFFLGNIEIGRDFAVIAGPCAVESREQVFSIARQLSGQGINLMRGGTVKIRTSPYAFQGMGMKGLKALKEAADHYNMTTVSEVVDTRHAGQAVAYVDCMQIGTRNMHNTSLLKAVAATGKPVVLKRGFGSTIEEWMYAGEYLALAGARQVIFCERGIRTFEPSMRFTLDLAGAVLLKQKTGLPVIIDPSHATGTPGLIIPLAMAARAAGLDGVIIEVSENPLKAMSDGAQALDFTGLDQLLKALDSLSIA